MCVKVISGVNKVSFLSCLINRTMSRLMFCTSNLQESITNAE